MDSIDSAINSAIEAKAAVTQQEIAYAILAKAKQSMKVQADAALELIRTAGRLGKALGKGQHIDLQG
jgi:hypothetical protein